MQDDPEAQAQALLDDLKRVDSSRDPKGAIKQARTAFTSIAEKLGENHHIARQALAELAHLYESTGAFQEAEAVWLRVLELAKESHGIDHPTYAIALNNLGESYREARQYTKAEAAIKEAIKRSAKAFGDNRMTLFSLHNLAARV